MPLDSILFVPWGIAVKQGEKGLVDLISQDHRRLAQDRLHPAARDEVGGQAHQVRRGDARQIQVAGGGQVRAGAGAAAGRRHRCRDAMDLLGLVPVAQRNRNQSHHPLRRVRSRPLRQRLPDDGQAVGHLHPAERADRRRRRVAAGLAPPGHADASSTGTSSSSATRRRWSSSTSSISASAACSRTAPRAARSLVSNVAWAVISLSFFAGAFNVEIFRSGIEAVPQTTIEAAESLGFSRCAPTC